jgi:hypothetical protein
LTTVLNTASYQKLSNYPFSDTVCGWVLAGLGRTEPHALTLTGIAAEYWRAEVALNCAASLSRLKAIVAERGADYAKTIAGLRDG